MNFLLLPYQFSLRFSIPGRPIVPGRRECRQPVAACILTNELLRADARSCFKQERISNPPGWYISSSSIICRHDTAPYRVVHRIGIGVSNRRLNSMKLLSLSSEASRSRSPAGALELENTSFASQPMCSPDKSLLSLFLFLCSSLPPPISLSLFLPASRLRLCSSELFPFDYHSFSLLLFLSFSFTLSAHQSSAEEDF